MPCPRRITAPDSPGTTPDRLTRAAPGGVRVLRILGDAKCGLVNTTHPSCVIAAATFGPAAPTATVRVRIERAAGFAVSTRLLPARARVAAHNGGKEGRRREWSRNEDQQRCEHLYTVILIHKSTIY